MNAAVELAALTGQDAEDLMLEAQRLAAERDALLPLSIGGRVKLPALGTVDPPPSLSVDVVRLPGTIREDDVLALISGDRQRALILYRLLAIMPDITDTAAYARWYRQWELLTAMDPGATPSPPPLHGGPTASPH